MGWLRRIGIGALALGIAVAAPIIRNETSCMSVRETVAQPYKALLPAESHRNGVDTFLTYPEWSIVHAYEDLATVTRQSGEEQFGYWQAVKGYWTSLCSLSLIASKRGDIALDMKAMLYIIGVSFSAEMAVKGLYETTIGRATAWLRGPERTPDDNFAIKVADDYAAFLRQTPWYEYPFGQTLRTFWTHSEPGKASLIRTVERRIALSLEWGVKALYAKGMGVLAGASPAKLTITTIVTDLPFTTLEMDRDVTIKATVPEGVIVETPRYRAFTAFLQRVAAAGGNIREIAGNDRIFVTLRRDIPPPDAVDSAASIRFAATASPLESANRTEVPHVSVPVLIRVPIQGSGNQERIGVEIAVANLTGLIQGSAAASQTPPHERWRILRLEHIYDY